MEGIPSSLSCVWQAAEGSHPRWGCGQVHKLHLFLHHLSSLPASLKESGGKRKRSKCATLHQFTLHKTAPGAFSPSWESDKNDLVGSSAGLWKMRPGSPCCPSRPTQPPALCYKPESVQSSKITFSTPGKKMFSADKTIYFHYGSRTFPSIIQYNVFIIKKIQPN